MWLLFQANYRKRNRRNRLGPRILYIFVLIAFPLAVISYTTYYLDLLQLLAFSNDVNLDTNSPIIIKRSPEKTKRNAVKKSKRTNRKIPSVRITNPVVCSAFCFLRL